MRARALAVCASLAATAATTRTLPAQAGPLPDDSIRVLIVDPARYGAHSGVVLLDEGILRLEADGRSGLTYRQVIQILTPDGAAAWGEWSVDYVPERQRVRLDRVRVLALDGSALSTEPQQLQESAPSVEAAEPVYTDRRVLHFSLGGVAPGTIVDVTYTVETFAPRLPGDWWQRWGFQGFLPMRRSRFVLDTPHALAVPVRQENLARGPTVTRAGDRSVQVWDVGDQVALTDELFAARLSSVVPLVEVRSIVSWDAIGRWLAALWEGRVDLPAEVRAAAAAELAPAASLRDSLLAAHRWVTGQFRYVAVSIGDGGYQPRPLTEILATRFGDCKDKTALFVALARAMGLDAYPVAVRSEGRVDSLAPSLRQFDHMIAAVRRDGDTEYTDLTTRLLPFGVLPAAMEGSVGLALTGDGGHPVTLPVSPADANTYVQDVEGEIDGGGTLRARIRLTASGNQEPSLRRLLDGVTRVDSATRSQREREFARMAYTIAVADSSRLTEGQDLATPPEVVVWFRVDSILGRTGGHYVLTWPLWAFAGEETATTLAEAPPRVFPIDREAVNDASLARSTLRITLPEGWRAILPADVAVEGPFGSYRARYRQAGRELRAERMMSGMRGDLPPDSAPALLAWIRSVVADGDEFVTIDPGSGPVVAHTTGALSDVLLTAADLGPDAQLAAEGAEAGEFALDFNTDQAVEVLARTFSAKQMVFTAGSSQLAQLVVSGSVYETHQEALGTIGMLGLIDLPRMLHMALQAGGMDQLTIGAGRAIDLTPVAHAGFGQIVEFGTPMMTMDLAMAIVVRGRTALSMAAIGARGIRADDIVTLFRTMDDRLQTQQTLLSDIPIPDYQDDSEATVRDSITRHFGELAGVFPEPETFPAPMRYEDALEAVDGRRVFVRQVTGRKFGFALGPSDALELSMAITRYPGAAEAAKAVELLRHAPASWVSRWLMADARELVAMFGVDLEVTQRHGADAGPDAVRMRLEMRGTMNADIDVVAFAHGPLVVAFQAQRAPGPPALAEVERLTRLVYDRVRQVAPAVPALPATQLNAIGRVARLEAALHDALEAGTLDAVFAAIAEAPLEEAGVDLAPDTWADVCRVAALQGRAAEALPACDAAVRYDSTHLERRDGRAVARALSGDLHGARTDLAYVVEHAEQGEFLDRRAGWLQALAAGQNPFTEAVLEQLRKEWRERG